MRYGSTFSGVGGLDLAVEHVFGATAAWHVEPDPYAAAVLRKHWPTVPNLGRIEEVDWTDERIERPDIICGGFPCQDISTAGKGAGLGGARSGLWWQLALAIGHIRPGIVVLENVAALVVRGLDAVIGELSRLGYDAAWSPFRASDVGAPHRRARMFIVAVDGSLSDADRELIRQERERARTRGEASRLARGDGPALADAAGDRGVAAHPGGADDLADTDDDGDREHGLRDDVGFYGETQDRGHNPVGRHGFPPWPPTPGDTEGWSRWHGALPGVCRIAYGPPRGLDARRRRARLRCLGNAVVPAQATEAIGQLWARLSAGGAQ